MKDKIIDFIMITIGTAVVAAAVFFFMMPSNVSVGSIAALAMIFTGQSWGERWLQVERCFFHVCFQISALNYVPSFTLELSYFCFLEGF